MDRENKTIKAISAMAGTLIGLGAFMFVSMIALRLCETGWFKSAVNGL